MPARFCPICRAPSAEGSTLCAAHRSQAAQFARAVAEGGGAPGAQCESADLVPAEIAGLRAEVDRALARIAERTRSRAGKEPEHGYPEIAVYVLYDRLRVRPYYAIAPAGRSAAAYCFDGRELAEALGRHGVLFEALAASVASRHAELKSGAIQMLVLELLSHADCVVLSSRGHAGRSELARFRWTGAGFAAAA